MKLIAPNIIRFDIPLAGSPLKMVHPYFIKGGERNLLIDTAFNTASCYQSLLEQLSLCGATPASTDIFVTHMHVDHSGLIGRLKCPGNIVYASVEDTRLMERFQDPAHWEWVANNNIWMGMPLQFRLDATKHVGYSNRSHIMVDVNIVSEGDVLTAGDSWFQVIDLPGHTPGQIGLWEPDTGILFCGDHILADISPNISAWDMEQDYLNLFLQSLEKVGRMEVKRLLPAHRREPSSIRDRIDALINHHHLRLAEVVDILTGSNGPMTVYQVALQLKWSSDKDVANMSAQQRWFACSETMAHLQYLFFRGQVSRSFHDNTYYYSLSVSLQTC